MSKICRFCKTGKLILRFPKNDQKQKKVINLFACTNSGFGRHGNIVFCPHCGLSYVDETISQKQISTYYEVAKDPEYFREQKARAQTFKRYLRRLNEQFPHKGCLLDIGTSTGLFVKLAKADGWQALGLEPNRWAVKYAMARYHIQLLAKPFAANLFPAKSFDVITMWDVLEHFTDPVGELVKVRNYLRPGGLFAFSTVDPESLLAKIFGTKWPWYMEMHKVFFSQTAAKFYLSRAGFSPIIFRPHWRFLSAGYLSSRLAAVNAKMAKGVRQLLDSLSLTKIIVPYYANDLFDCYAFKSK